MDRLEGRGRTDADAKRTTIRLGVSHAYTRIAASPLVSAALRASGNPALRIHTGWSIPLLKELQESRLDAALMGFPGRWSPPADLRSEPVREEELVVIAPRDAKIRGITRLRDLAPHPWILNSEGCGLRARLQAEFAEAGRSLNIHVELRGSLSQHIEFVAAGFGFGLVPLCALSIHPQRREVRRVPLKETLATSLWVLWRASDRAAEARWAGIRAALIRSATARALNISVPKGRCSPCFSITPRGTMQVPAVIFTALANSGAVRFSQRSSMQASNVRLAGSITRGLLQSDVNHWRAGCQLGSGQFHASGHAFALLG